MTVINWFSDTKNQEILVSNTTDSRLEYIYDERDDSTQC